MHNENSGKFAYTLEMNKFGDLDDGEFAKIYNGRRSSSNSNTTAKFVATGAQRPSEIDWRTKGCVSGVKDQGLDQEQRAAPRQRQVGVVPKLTW